MKHFTHMQTSAKIYILLISMATIAYCLIISFIVSTNSPVVDNMDIFLSGYTEIEEIREREINYLTQEIKDEKLEEGKTQTIKNGINGRERLTYKVLKNKQGIEIKRQLTNRQIITPSTTKIIAIGSKKTKTSSSTSESATAGKNNSNTTQNTNQKQQTSPTKNVKYYYCTWAGRADKGNTYYYRYFVKQANVDCGRDPSISNTVFDARVSKKDYYSHEIFHPQGNNNYGIVEMRIQTCGFSYSYEEDTKGEGCGCYNPSPKSYFKHNIQCENPKNKGL